MREKTVAHRKLIDDVSVEDKQRRLKEILNVFELNRKELLKKELGRVHLVLIDKVDKEGRFKGKTDTFKDIVLSTNSTNTAQLKRGDFVEVRVTDWKGKTLFGDPLSISSIPDFSKKSHGRPYIY